MGQITTSKSTKLSLISAFVRVLAVFSLFIGANAYAQTKYHKTTFEELVTDDALTLDWKQKEVVIPFDLPDTIWVDNVEMLVSARPIGPTGYNRDLKIQINDGEPIDVEAWGQRFDARLKISMDNVFPRNNKITFTTAYPNSCAGPEDARWKFSDTSSMLVFSGRAMKRETTFSDIHQIWNNKISIPRNIGIKATGSNKLRYESLIAQSVALRYTGDINFRSVSAENNIDIIIGKRSDIRSLTKTVMDKPLTHAVIQLDSSAEPRIILTGETDAHVEEAVYAFATRKLPKSARTKILPSQIGFHSKVGSKTPKFDATHELAAAGSLLASNGWATGPSEYRFDVDNAQKRSGELLLKVNAGENLSAQSRLLVKLNGHELGETQLDKERKTVRFNIPENTMIGHNNLLTITPDFQPAENISNCDLALMKPSFGLGKGSKIILNGAADLQERDLANFTGNAAPFASSDNLVIYSTAKSQNDQRAVTELMAHLARRSGRVWTNAKYYKAGDIDFENISPSENILIIGPNSQAFTPALTHAPKALKLAMGGQAIPNLSAQKLDDILRLASADEETAIKIAAKSAAQKLASEAKLARMAGLVAVFDEPLTKRTIGIITTRPGANFNYVADAMRKDHIWSKLQGSVAQWNNKQASMAQLALPNLSYVAPSLRSETPFKGSKFSFAKNIYMPDLSDMNFSGLSEALSVASEAVSNKADQISKFTGEKFSGLSRWASTAISNLKSKTIRTAKPEDKGPKLPLKTPETVHENTAFLDQYLDPTDLANSDDSSIPFIAEQVPSYEPRVEIFEPEVKTVAAEIAPVTGLRGSSEIKPVKKANIFSRFSNKLSGWNNPKERSQNQAPKVAKIKLNTAYKAASQRISEHLNWRSANWPWKLSPVLTLMILSFLLIGLHAIMSPVIKRHS